MASVEPEVLSYLDCRTESQIDIFHKNCVLVCNSELHFGSGEPTGSKVFLHVGQV